MDAYFKSYFGTFVFGALFVGAFLTAKITNVFVARALEPPVSSLYVEARAVRATPKRDTSPTTTNRAAFLTRNPFDAEVEQPKSAEEAQAEKAAAEAAKTPEVYEGECDPGKCQPSSVAANLLATLWSGNPGTSYAVFQSTTDQKFLRVSASASLLDATVTAIYRNRVCVSHNGTCEIFTLGEAPKPVQRRPRVAAAPRRRNDDSSIGDGVRKTGDQEYEIDRAEIDNVLSNLNVIARQARIVPSFKDGKANGFKLFSIRPNSLYSKIGIQNGDIVQRINGYEMNSPDKALQIYSKLKDANQITVDLIRRGKPVSLSYAIR